MKRGTMRISCARTGCGRLFEEPMMRIQEFQKLYRSHGWKDRGSVTGRIHFCHEHDDR
jgi:hypothetical protein